MPKRPQRLPAGENAILARLPPTERDRLMPHLERAPLGYRQVLQETDRPLEYAWFPLSGVGSMVSSMADGSTVEVATVGREGMVSFSIVLGARRTAHTTFVQVPGEALRMRATAFAELLDSLPELRAILLRYALALVTQIAQGSACNRMHPIEARCARWLLFTHDRVDADDFPLTHEFLAQMLGVTRPSVTLAAGMLQKAGLIEYSRGVVRILDRPGLEDAACECYGVVAEEFRRLLQPEP